MSGEFEFPFEDLPTIIERGFAADMTANGTATISYHTDGEWFITEIALDASRERSSAERAIHFEKTGGVIGRFESKRIIIDRASYAWLYDAIYDQLENGRFKSQIEAKIDDELGHAGISRADPNREHSTLNRTQQGV